MLGSIPRALQALTQSSQQPYKINTIILTPTLGYRGYVIRPRSSSWESVETGFEHRQSGPRAYAPTLTGGHVNGKYSTRNSF